MNAISQHCYHVEVSPGQMCSCLDALMWTRLALELTCRRVAELEAQAQHSVPRLLLPAEQ